MFPLRQTIRVLLKAPGFTITAILILGLGIGANTAIFSLINSVVLKPLPFEKADRLVLVSLPYQNAPQTDFDYPDYLDVASSQTSFDSIGVCRTDSLDLTGSGETQRLSVGFISSSLFRVTGRGAILGRTFTSKEDISHGPMLVVLSERFWRSHFNADPAIIGKQLTLSEQSFQIIGVAPAQMDIWKSTPTDVYLPVNSIALFDYPLLQRGVHFVDCYARLKNGVGISQAQAEMETIHDQLVDRYPDTNKGYGVRVTSLLESVVGGYSETVWLLGASVGFLLLIAASNVANLLFARGLERRREVAVRAALGASRLRLGSQLLFETALLTLAGGIVGLASAFWAVGLIKRLSPADINRFQEVGVDFTALLFVVAVIVLVAFTSGIVPAWSLSKAKLGSVLKEEGGRTGTSGLQKYRVQTILVGGQVALACILLIGAGLLVRSFEAAQNVWLGFNPHHVLTAELMLTGSTYESDATKTRTFYDSVLEKIRKLPGVSEAAMNDTVPLDHDSFVLAQFTIDGQPDPGPGRHPVLNRQMISPNYFRTLEIPLLKGRDFNEQDKADRQPVVIVDDGLADHFFPGQDPIGQAINFEYSRGVRRCTIVGVVSHVRDRSPGYQENRFQAYFPYSQWNYDTEILLVRCEGDPHAQITSIRNVVQAVDPDVPVPNIKLFDDLISQNLVTRKLGTLIVSLFAGAALFLSVIGLYGALSYSTSQRRREIGVRIALGAESLRILHMVAEQGFKLIVIGLIAGIVPALVCAHLIESVLYGVTPIDPISMLTAIVVLFLAGCLACVLPALRAVRTDPVKVLRE